MLTYTQMRDIAKKIDPKVDTCGDFGNCLHFMSRFESGYKGAGVAVDKENGRVAPLVYFIDRGDSFNGGVLDFFTGEPITEGGRNR